MNQGQLHTYFSHFYILLIIGGVLVVLVAFLNLRGKSWKRGFNSKSPLVIAIVAIAFFLKLLVALIYLLIAQISRIFKKQDNQREPIKWNEVLKQFLFEDEAVKKGREGESELFKLLQRKLSPDIYLHLHDIMLPTKDGATTQIDHILVSQYGVFIIEMKNYNGWIFGQKDDAQWMQILSKKRSRFQNPLRQNYKHTKTLMDTTGLTAEYIWPVVVFADTVTFKTEMPPNVVKMSNVVDYIKSFTTPVFASDYVSNVSEVIQRWAATITPEQRKRHVENLRSSPTRTPY